MLRRSGSLRDDQLVLPVLSKQSKNILLFSKKAVIFRQYRRITLLAKTAYSAEMNIHEIMIFILVSCGDRNGLAI